MRNLILIFLLLPFIFAGSFQSYTEKTTPEASDIFLILDNDDLTTKKVQVGNIGDGINWDSVNIQAGGINWTSLDQDIQKGGVNWTSLDDSIQSSGVNWASLNQDIQYDGINWTSANMAVGGPLGNVGIGTTATNIRFAVKSAGSFLPEIRAWKENSSTNTAESMIDFIRQTSGTGAIGLGSIMRFYIEDDANVNTLAYSMSPETTDATNGSYDSLVREAMTENGTLKTQWIKRSNGLMAFNLNDNGNIVPNAPVDIYGDGSTTGYGLITRSNPPTGTIRVVIQDNGNVGIGTAFPQASLNIVKSSTTAPLMISSTGGGLGDYQIIDSSGNVGIGTNLPEGKFIVRTTSSIGWTAKTGANTACNTTCVSGCVAGLDSGSPTFLLCTDATADSCLCSGSD